MEMRRQPHLLIATLLLACSGLAAERIHNLANSAQELLDSNPDTGTEASDYFLYHLHVGHTGGSTLKSGHAIWAPQHVSCFTLGLQSFGSTVPMRKRFRDAKIRESACYQNKALRGTCARAFMNETGCGVWSFEGNYEDVHMFLPGGTLFITFFRQPLFRMISAAQHFRERHHHTLDEELSDTGSPDGFVQKFCSDTIGHLNSNLEGAILRMKTFFFIGLTEDYDQSLCLLAWQLGGNTEAFCARQDVLQQVNSESAPTETIRLDVAKKILQTYCVNDTVLYSAAVVEYHQRLKTASDLGFGGIQAPLQRKPPSRTGGIFEKAAQVMFKTAKEKEPPKHKHKSTSTSSKKREANRGLFKYGLLLLVACCSVLIWGWGSFWGLRVCSTCAGVS